MIIDDDIDIKSLLPENQGSTVDEFIGDDDPTIVAIIDERPDNIKQLESYRHSDGRWKMLGKGMFICEILYYNLLFFVLQTFQTKTIEGDNCSIMKRHFKQ